MLHRNACGRANGVGACLYASNNFTTDKDHKTSDASFTSIGQHSTAMGMVTQTVTQFYTKIVSGPMTARKYVFSKSNCK